LLANLQKPSKKNLPNVQVVASAFFVVFAGCKDDRKRADADVPWRSDSDAKL
jgi:hypothetical protein